MRILIVDTCYPAFLTRHYGDHPGLEEQPYDVQWRTLMDAFFGTADSYSHHLSALGHSAHEFIVNCSELQESWAAEHELHPQRRALRGRSRRDALLLAQAEAFEPDVCYVQNLEALQISTLRELARRGHLLVGHVSTEPPRQRRLGIFDLLVTPVPYLVDRFTNLGLEAEYLPLAFDDRVLAHLAADEPTHGAVFVGSLKRFRRWRSNRIVEQAAHAVDVDFWGYGAREWPSTSPVRTRYHGEAWGLGMFQVLASGRAAINRHGDITRGYACNMRLFEATGVGTMLLTDGHKNLGDLFAPGREVVGYSDAADLAAKIRHYLAAEDERREIARAGQARTLADHTYGTRMAQLAQMIELQLGAEGRR